MHQRHKRRRQRWRPSLSSRVKWWGRTSCSEHEERTEGVETWRMPFATTLCSCWSKKFQTITSAFYFQQPDGTFTTEIDFGRNRVHKSSIGHLKLAKQYRKFIVTDNNCKGLGNHSVSRFLKTIQSTQYYFALISSNKFRGETFDSIFNEPTKRRCVTWEPSNQQQLLSMEIEAYPQCCWQQRHDSNLDPPVPVPKYLDYKNLSTYLDKKRLKRMSLFWIYLTHPKEDENGKSSSFHA